MTGTVKLSNGQVVSKAVVARVKARQQPASYMTADQARKIAIRSAGTGSAPSAPDTASAFGDDSPAADPTAGARALYESLTQAATAPANAAYGNTLSDSLAGEGSYALDLGATLGGRDPNADPSAVTQGSFNWGNVEASNPFSKAAALVRSYGQQRARTTNGLAARGQLYSSAMAHQRGQDTYGYQSGQDSLNKALLGYLTGQAGVRRNAAVDRTNTISNAGLSGLNQLLGG